MVYIGSTLQVDHLLGMAMLAARIDESEWRW